MGSLINLAKAPASTIQILGAEKALFRALKTKKDTPKYGLIYHSALVTSATTKNKGKISRMLSSKAALCTRLDAMGEDNTLDLGVEHKAKLEARLRLLEEGNLRRLSGTGKAKAKFEKYHGKSEVHQYPTAADSTLPTKRKLSETEDKKPLIEELSSEVTHKSKKIKKEPGFETPVKVKDEEGEGVATSSKKKKKKKKMKAEEAEEDIPEPEPEVPQPEVTESGKKKKKRKHVQEAEQESEEVAAEAAADITPTPEKKKKKKKKKSFSEV